MLQLNRTPSHREGNILAGRYCLHEEIGRGRFGAVFRADDLKSGREVAVKLAERGCGGEFARKVFENESGALSAIDHPSVIRLVGSGTSGAEHFIAMEYVPGMNMKEFLHRRKIPPRISLEIMAGICQTLETLHSCGVVHRDLKPKNTMVRFEGGVKLIDFGFASRKGSPDITGGFSKPFGSPLYSPPEDLRGNGDHRTDIYSAGVMMYEMLMERSRFYIIDALKLLELRVSLSRLLQLSQGGSRSRGALEIVMCATERDPAKRFQGAAAMREAIESEITFSIS